MEKLFLLIAHVKKIFLITYITELKLDEGLQAIWAYHTLLTIILQDKVQN